MEELTILRTFGAVTTVLAATLVAANVNARITVAGFMIFIIASIAWMVDGKCSTPERDCSSPAERLRR